MTWTRNWRGEDIGSAGTLMFFQALVVPEWRAWIGALSGKGWWRLAGTPQASEAMSLDWFNNQGLISLTKRFLTLNL